MKKFNCIIAFLLGIFVLAGCSGGSYKIINGEIESYDNSIKGEYSNFMGKYYKEIKLEKGKTLTYNCKICTVGGVLFAKILNSDGKEMLNINMDGTYNVPKTDTYKIQVQGDKHNGSFLLTWK